MNRFPSKTNALQFIRSKGVEVATILDVGVMTDTKELMEVYPDKRHILFEPVTNFHNVIRSNYAAINYELVPVAVSNMTGDGSLIIEHAGGVKRVTHARLINESVEAETRQVSTTTLDDFLDDREETAPYLLKIDVDGHELEILEGAEYALQNTNCVIVEIKTENWLERSAFLLRRGFFLVDIVDLCYYKGTFAQADFIFVGNEFRENFDHPGPEADPNFDWDSWRNLSRFEDGMDWTKG